MAGFAPATPEPHSDRIGLSDIRLHDYAAQLRSMMAHDGASLLMVGKVLNHAESRTTARAYAHLGSDAGRDRLERHGAKVIDLLMRRKVG